MIKKNASTIRKILKNDFDLNIAGGQDKLKTSLFRINQMGMIPLNESVWVVNAIELALDKLSLRRFDGLGNKVFLESYYRLNG